MSSTLTPLVLGRKACAWIQGDLVAPAFRRQRGFVNEIVRNGVGDYTLTLSDAISHPYLTFICDVNLFAVIAAEVVTPTTIRVLTARVSAGGPGVAPADFSYWIVVEEFGPD